MKKVIAIIAVMISSGVFAWEPTSIGTPSQYEMDKLYLDQRLKDIETKQQEIEMQQSTNELNASMRENNND